MGATTAPTDRADKRTFYADPDRRPDVLPVRPESIPEDLKGQARWVLWALEWRPKADGAGAWAKLPKSTTGRTVDATRPANWLAFDDAHAAYRAGGFDGLGFALGDGFVGIDLDDVRDPGAGAVTAAWAADLVARAGTYAEVSPSGTGLKLFARGRWCDPWNKRPHPSGAGEVEVYGGGRFFCVTGHPAADAATVADTQPVLDQLATLFAPPGEPPGGHFGGTGGCPLSDDDLLDRIRRSRNGDKFAALFDRGDASGYGGDESRADLALVGLLAFWAGPDPARIDRLFRRSKLLRPKWDARRKGTTYGANTITKGLSGQTEYYAWGPRVTFSADPPGADDWPDPVPLAPAFDPPPFPVEVLSPWMAEYVIALAEEKQVPVDLPAMLALGAAAGGIARKVTVSPWPGWTREPTNQFVICFLPPGERKSQTFSAVFDPVRELEAELVRQAEPRVAEAEGAFRVAQKRVDHLEARMAKADDPADRAALGEQLAAARQELLAVAVPPRPQLRVDDDTPEMMGLELVKQGGRLLAASPEARTLENIDRYSDAPNVDVFLKGHAGDDIRSGRIGRGRDAVDRPALTCCYSPQPCVLERLGATPELRGRGFLARWFYSVPVSRVGFRRVRAAAVPQAVRARYESALIRLWWTPYRDAGADEPHDLTLTPEAQGVLEEFERWKEALLRPGGELADCGGWGNKLGGLAVRLCGLLHATDGIPDGYDWTAAPIPAATVRRAVALCRDYAVPHARAAFGRMGESATVANARALLRWIGGRPVPAAPFSKKEAFDGCRGTFKTVLDLEPALGLLARHHLIRPRPAPGDRPGPGRKPSPVYEVNPADVGPAAAQNPHNTP